MMNNRKTTPRRGFTLIEMLVAGLITSFVLGSLSMSLSQLTSAKASTKARLTAHMRANSALESIRQDIASIIRNYDLFWTRFLLDDDSIANSLGTLDRDSLLLFSTKLRPIHPINFTGEGIEYETQYRIEEDGFGPVLWQRRDASPDEFPKGGGTATPIVEGILAINFEVYDGQLWYEKWDSDVDGLPVAVRITITASGHALGADAYDETTPIAIMRTIVAIDRVILPSDIPENNDLPPLEGENALPGGGSGGDNGNTQNGDGNTGGVQNPTDGGTTGSGSRTGSGSTNSGSVGGGGGGGGGSSTGNRETGSTLGGNR